MAREDDKCVVLPCGATRECSEEWLDDFEFIEDDGRETHDFRSVGFADDAPSPLQAAWLDKDLPCSGRSRVYLPNGTVQEQPTANVWQAGCVVFFLDAVVVQENTSSPTSSSPSSSSSSSSSSSGGGGGGSSTSMVGQGTSTAPPPPSTTLAALRTGPNPSSTSALAGTPPGVVSPATLQIMSGPPAPPQPPVPPASTIAQAYHLIQQYSAILPTTRSYVWEGPGLSLAQSDDLCDALLGVHQSGPTHPFWKPLSCSNVNSV